jgi:3-hydroxyacyl-CoA dehydrogenase
MTVQFEQIKTIGVVGAGLMGAGIAQALATSGLKVILTDRDLPALKGSITNFKPHWAPFQKDYCCRMRHRWRARESYVHTGCH